jgi:hypothetical protein
VGSGIDRGNAYGCPNAPAYQGSQSAFLQGAGQGNGVTSISQEVSGFQVGQTYVLSFEAAGIEGYSLGFGGADPFSVSVGGSVVTFGGSNWLSPSYSYGLYCSDPFVATSPTMTLRFYDQGNVPATFVSFLDDVQITRVPEPSTGVSLLVVAGTCCAAAIAGWRLPRRAAALRLSESPQPDAFLPSPGAASRRQATRNLPELKPAEPILRNFWPGGVVPARLLLYGNTLLIYGMSGHLGPTAMSERTGEKVAKAAERP